MDPMPPFSQNNQFAGKDKLNMPPENLPLKPDIAPENIREEGFNIKIPPQGVLNSSRAAMNFNSAVKPDKNIKVDLDLNSAPPLGASPAKNIASAGFVPEPDFQPGRSGQNNSLPPQAPDNGYKNIDPYKLSNSELQGPKPPLVPNKNRASIFILVAGLALGALAIGGYYIYTKNNNNIPITVSSPSPLPTSNATLDSDSDTIPDAVEKAIGTDPNKIDTDGDGFNDLSEIKNGYSPTVAGAAGKLSLQGLQILKDKIEIADKKFYDSVFGVPPPAPSQSLSPTISPVIK